MADPVSAASQLTPVGIAASVLQTGLGIYQTISGSAKLKRAMAQRKAYKTPEEIYKILNATQGRVNQGLAPESMDFLLNQTDRATASAAGLTMRMGGDTNALSAMLDRRIQSIMQIGDIDARERTRRFGEYLTSVNLVAENKTAEWKSEQDIIKDKIQSAATDRQAGVANIAGGFNTAIGVDSAARVSALYKEKLRKEEEDRSVTLDSRYFRPPSVNAPIDPSTIPY